MVNLEVKDISIVDYVRGLGIDVRKEGNRYFCSSPFSSDRNWSFCIYPTNSYFDWSTGSGGGICTLHARIRGISNLEAWKELKDGIKVEKYKPNYKKIKEDENFWKEFSIERYINTRPDEVAAIKAYAEGRGISEGYLPGVFFTRKDEKWIRNPSMMFVHVDKDLSPCGAKFRKIKLTADIDQSPRFSARGKIGVYIVKSNISAGLEKETVYVVEGEANANSLAMYLRSIKKPASILSFGGVASPLKDFPTSLQGLPIKLIIDYDGNDQLYRERLARYKELNAEPIRLILPKGEDINSLYVKNQMYLIENLL